MIPLRRQRDYRLLWSARAVTEAGSEVSRLAVPLTAVTLLAASPLEMGVLTAAASLPFLFVGLPVGVWADRVRRRRPVLVLCELISGTAVATIPVAWLLGLLTVHWLIGVALVVGACTVTFRNFTMPHLTSVVAEPQRTEAIAGMQSVFSIAQLGGPGLAGVLVSVLSAPLALVVNAVTFVTSALLLRSIRAEEPARPASPRRSLRREIAEGMSALARHPVLRALALCGMTVNLFAAAQLAVYVLYAVQVLGLPGGLVGIMMMGFGAGGLVGAFVAPRLSRRHGGPAVLLAAVLFFPLGFLVMAAVSGPVWWCVLLIGAAEAVVGVAVVCFSVCSGAMSLQETAPELIGRVNASINFLTQGALGIGALLGGVAGELLGLRPAMWACFAGALLTIPCLWLSPLVGQVTRRVRAPRDAAEATTLEHARR
ncbi:MFS transporter [Herbidospora sp. NBRC 101105]|uniref:MFS transporter n=1 Tax=Herbidospora sp. NBRC 101105 TaxID=3032195 RepID=UPI0024A1F336|nr:MFS transporter [Herbidospora sp. NBRC 101105]GLX98058.1 MFS transporter [Herbidospora sp. NBRC 101105]